MPILEIQLPPDTEILSQIKRGGGTSIFVHVPRGPVALNRALWVRSYDAEKASDMGQPADGKGFLVNGKAKLKQG